MLTNECWCIDLSFDTEREEWICTKCGKTFRGDIENLEEIIGEH